MTAPLFLAAYTFGSAMTLGALVVYVVGQKNPQEYLIGSFFAALTWPAFWPAFIVWKIGKALRGKR